MKHIIIVGDGMADRPIKRLTDKTPLMVADTPNIDALCAKSRTGKFRTVPEDMPPGSEVANMAVLGYDVRKVYQGRGVIEAASMGVELKQNDLTMRCNLICVEDGKIKNHSADHISTEEARQLIGALNEELGSEDIKFHTGVSYRHLFVLKNGINNIKLTPPHGVPERAFKGVLIKQTSENGKKTAERLNELIFKSQELLKEHPTNKKRISEGKDPANSIWFWSSGYKSEMKTLKELFGIDRSAVISAVDLINGLGIYAGMDLITVEGITGLHDTNYEGKAEAAVEALKDHDFVYLHIEASDEAGHEGNVELKIKTIEYLDKRVVKYIMENTEDVAIAILPDHPTPCEIRRHTHDPVPFLIYHPGESPDDVTEYNEISVDKGFYGTLEGDQFIKSLLKIRF